MFSEWICAKLEDTCRYFQSFIFVLKRSQLCICLQRSATQYCLYIVWFPFNFFSHAHPSWSDQFRCFSTTTTCLLFANRERSGNNVEHIYLKHYPIKLSLNDQKKSGSCCFCSCGSSSTRHLIQQLGMCSRDTVGQVVCKVVPMSLMEVMNPRSSCWQ